MNNRQYLRDLRFEKGLTAKEIGEKLDISESYYCLIENGARQQILKLSTIEALSKAFNKSESEIIRLEKEYQSCLEAKGAKGA